MPLAEDYTPEAIAENIRTLRRDGRDEAEAVAIAYNTAREAWWKRNPTRALPDRLQPKNDSAVVHVPFRQHDRVYVSVRSGHHTRDRVHYTVVTGRPMLRLWEGVGWNGRTKEPHLLVRSEDTGQTLWEATRLLHHSPR